MSVSLNSIDQFLNFALKNRNRKFTHWYTIKPVLSGRSKRIPKLGFQGRLSLNAGQKYCRMLHESILQYFRPSLSYHLSLRPLFCLFLSDHLRQVLLNTIKELDWEECNGFCGISSGFTLSAGVPFMTNESVNG